MFGQPASWHTVCRPSRCTRPRIAVNSGPIFALTLIHGGLRSIGVSALRASMRSIRRPSGPTCAAPLPAAVDIDGAWEPFTVARLRPAVPYAEVKPPRTRRTSRSGRLRPVRENRRSSGDRRQVTLDDRTHLINAHVTAQLEAERRHAGVPNAARDDLVVRAHVGVTVEGEAVHGHTAYDTDANRGNLSRDPRRVRRQPNAAATVDANGVHTQLGAHMHEHLLDATDVRNDVNRPTLARAGQRQDRIPHQLSRAVPGDLAAPVDVDD